MPRLIYGDFSTSSSNKWTAYCDENDTIVCYGKWCSKTLAFEAAPGISIHYVVEYVLNQSTTYNRDAMLTFNGVQLKIPKQTSNQTETINNIVASYFSKCRKRNRGN